MRQRMGEIWRTLNRSIFVGERYEKNLHNIAAISGIFMAMGFMMSLLNILQGQYFIALSPLLIVVTGLISFVSASRYRRRDVAIVASTVSVVVVLTLDVLFVDNGFAFLWVLLVPLTVCYMFSVKMGLLITAYFQLLLTVTFYTPIRRFVAPRYTETVMNRFPLLFFFHGLVVLYVMYQYHKSVLFEIEHTNSLHEEVARQTAVAEERSRRIERMSFEAIQTLAHAIDAKDPYTRGHSTRVSGYSVMVAEAMGWDKDRVNGLRCAALLHDIGKIGIPDSILNNPDRLTEVEYGIIKSHTTMGGDILKSGMLLEAAVDVALSHHERYDGGGYPRGLKGEAISEEARIVATADAFDAMSSNRVYRRACDRENIRRELVEGRGGQFDPVIVDIFLKLWDRGLLDGILEDRAAEAADADRGDAPGPSMVCITLERDAGEAIHGDTAERAIFYMEKSIQQVTGGAGYIVEREGRRFIVPLSEAKPGDAGAIVDRIIMGYYKMNGSGAFSPAYTFLDGDAPGRQSTSEA